MLINDCGAELLNAPYTMYEYPSIEKQNADAGGLHDIIISTFVDHRRIYVIEQVQSVENHFLNGVHLIAASDSDTGDIHRGESNRDNTLILQLQRTYTSIAEPIGIFFITSGFDKTDRLVPEPLDYKALKLAVRPVPSEASHPNSNHIARVC